MKKTFKLELNAEPRNEVKDDVNWATDEMPKIDGELGCNAEYVKLPPSKRNYRRSEEFLTLFEFIDEYALYESANFLNEVEKRTVPFLRRGYAALITREDAERWIVYFLKKYGGDDLTPSAESGVELEDYELAEAE